ncbi:MAG: SGNH/GDSL hydrolase family protein [Planctomycetes bacterium]|nr:SGNH/GDSL hydrolase family protein [Planctomycetota bacterium]
MTGPIGPKPPRDARKLLLVVASLLVALAGAEVLLRFFHPVDYRRPIARPPGHVWMDVVHQPSTTPGLTYELRPGAIGEAKDAKGGRVVVNARGMRGPELVEPKGARTLRVAVLGDSVAFGFGVEQDQLFSARLAAKLGALEDRAHDYEVLNFAVTGYSSREEAVVLEAKALPLAPDVIVVAYYLNDPDFGPVNALRMAFHPTEAWERSELLRFLAQKAHQLELARNGGDYYRWLHAPDTDEWKSVPQAFARMHSLAAAKQLHVVLAIFPTFALDVERGKERTVFATWDEYGYAPLHAQVRKAAEQESFTVLDVLDVFRASGKTPRELARDPDHPNALGHDLAADALGKLLLERHAEFFGSER